MLVDAISIAERSSTTYNWIWTLIGVAAIAGGAITLVRWLNRRAVREDKLDQLLKKTSKNGGNTDSVGDIASRVETKLDTLTSVVATQKGHTDTIEIEVFKRLGALEARMNANEMLTQSTAAQVSTIVSEVHPDSGHSLRDAVNKIVDEQDRLAGEHNAEPGNP